MNDELPCLDLLEATPAILRGLMSEISDEDARWKPAPDRFSIRTMSNRLGVHANFLNWISFLLHISERLPIIGRNPQGQPRGHRQSGTDVIS